MPTCGINRADCRHHVWLTGGKTSYYSDEGYWNEVASLERTKHGIVHHMLYPERDGRFAGLCVAERVAKRVYCTELFVSEGDIVRRAVDGSDAIGYVDFAFDDAQEQMEAALEMERLVCIELEEGLR